MKTIELFKPHKAQLEVINSLMDKDTFFVTMVSGRQIGKSMLGMNMAIYWCINDPNCVVYWVSPTDSQAHKVYKQILDAIYQTGEIYSNKGGKGDTEIIFKNKSKILFRSAASEDSLRGESVNYMILDEGAFIKPSTVNIILLPMLNVKGKKCLVITTPKGKNWVYDWFNKGFVEKRWKSFRYSTYDSPYANEELINMFKETLADKLFQQEIMADFVDSAAIFNNINELLSLQQLEEPNGSDYYAGIDIGILNDSSVLSIIDKSGNLVKYYRWTNIDSPKLIENIKDVCNKWKFKKVLIEDNNQGIVIYQTLKPFIQVLERFNTNSKTKPEIINNLIHSFNMKDFNLVKDEHLRIELEGFIFEQNSNGAIKFMAASGLNDDCVMSLAIARWCWKTKQVNKNIFGIF